MNKILVAVIDNGNSKQLETTTASLKKQTLKQYEIEVIAWDKFRNFWDFQAEYVWFVYSGSVLENCALEIVEKKISAMRPKWLYCDERTFDAEFNNILSEYYAKPAFGKIGFASYLYTGEGIIVSKEILKTVQLIYKGYNFRVAMLELALCLAAISDGEHIANNLLIHHKRKCITLSEYKLINNCLNEYLEVRKIPFSGVLNDDAKGAGLYFQEEICKKISFVILGERKTGIVDTIINTYHNDYEIIYENSEDLYCDQVLSGAQKATGEIICFLDASCSIPLKEELEKMLAYLEMEEIGIVSPCLKNDIDKSIFYAGASTVGQKMCSTPQAYSEHQNSSAYCLGTREISVPAWQFWMIKREDYLKIEHDGDVARTKNCMMLDYALQLEKIGKKSLYCGETTIYSRCAVEEIQDIGIMELLLKWGRRFAEDPYFTADMRAKIYNFREKNTALYYPEKDIIEKDSCKRILVLSHELSMTGAPIVLSYAVRILKEAGWQVVVLSPKDGVLRETFLEEQVPVMIRENIMNDESWLVYAKEFDVILVNTIVPYPCIEQLKNVNIPVIWWLHDARGGYEVYLKNVLPERLGDNIHTLCVSHYAQAVVNEFRPQYKTDLLLYGLADIEVIDDHMPEMISRIGKRKLFVSVGTIEKRKGQDVLVEAIRSLPKEVLEQCVFLIIGKCVDRDVYEKVRLLENDYPESVWYEQFIKHEDIFKIYKSAVAVICSSRDDPLPTFMTETMMQSGICICSEYTGTAALIKHGENGFLYKNNDPMELAECIHYVVSNDFELEAIGQAGRKLYEEMFSLNVFKQNLLYYVDIYLQGDGKGDC